MIEPTASAACPDCGHLTVWQNPPQSGWLYFCPGCHHCYEGDEVGGYRRKAATAGPIPTCAPERFKGVVDDPIQQVKELIGPPPRNQSLSVVTRQNNINQALSILNRLPDTHVLVERMTLGDFANKWGWSAAREGLARDFGIIKPDPDPIEALAAKYGVPIALVREIKETLA